jgi:hypothetical protein
MIWPKTVGLMDRTGNVFVLPRLLIRVSHDDKRRITGATVSLARITSSHPKKSVVLREFKDGVFLKKRLADPRQLVADCRKDELTI